MGAVLSDTFVTLRNRAGLLKERLLIWWSRQRLRFGYPIRPHALYLETLNACNAACVFCAYPQMKRVKKLMSMHQFEQALYQHGLNGGTDVDLTPIVGEPLADRLLPKRLDYLQTATKFRYHFYTNAILMTPRLAYGLAHHSRLSVFISLGGLDKDTYHRIMGVDKFIEACRGIRLLVAECRSASINAGQTPPKVQVNLRLPAGHLPQNFTHLWLKELERAGYVTLDYTDAYDNWGGDITEETLKSHGLVPLPRPKHRGACRRLLTSPVVLADGRVNACACRDVEATLIIGDLNQSTLAEVLGGKPLQELVKRHEKGDWPEICKSCTRYLPI